MNVTGRVSKIIDSSSLRVANTRRRIYKKVLNKIFMWVVSIGNQENGNINNTVVQGFFEQHYVIMFLVY